MATAALCVLPRPNSKRSPAPVKKTTMSSSAAQNSPQSSTSKDMYTWEMEDLCYSMAWSGRTPDPFRLAVCSFKQEASNYVQIVSLDVEADKLVCPSNMTFRHDYPATKIMFIPDKDGTRPDLLATTGEFLRIWGIQQDGVQLERLLTNSNTRQFNAPLTSFDWSETDTRRLGVCSIDTTCTIWDIERGDIETQLIAHDKEVYDIAWGGSCVFGTVSADGSLRVFDLREKEHSTIIYESPDNVPLLRLAWNKQDPRYVSTIALDTLRATILDIRYPSTPCMELCRHSAHVNAVAWAPHSARHICTAGDDAQVYIWELSRLSEGQNSGGQEGSGGSSSSSAVLDPILAYNAGAEINQVQWSGISPEWLGICFDNRTQILRV